MEYPKILVIAIGKINNTDNSNNGLLFRNLLRNWPKENLAQIYSSGDNGDMGFFGKYYHLSKTDRRFGHLYYMIKNEVHYKEMLPDIQAEKRKRQRIKAILTNIFINSGIHELLFKVKLSNQMENWIVDFNPEIVLAQGYNISFTLLPILVKNKFNFKLAFFTTDDWPRYLYNGMLGENRILSFFARFKAVNLSNKLIKLSDVTIAFGQPMANEYKKRFNKDFFIVSHSDDPKRFDLCQPKRLNTPDIFDIVTIGNFNCYRWPLILDLNEACSLLNEEGLRVRISVLSSAIDPAGLSMLNAAKYVDIYQDPGNDELPCFLKGADLLFLPEGFDENFVKAIRFSISTKAHLFMFSQKPILVYAHRDTGIANYALESNWATVLTERSIHKLMELIKEQIVNKEAAAIDAFYAYNFALKSHDITKTSQLFQTLLSGEKSTN